MNATQEQSNGKKSDQLAYLWLMIGAILLLFANGKWIAPIATWLFPVFFIRFMRTQKSAWHILICAIVYASVFCIAWQGLIPFPGILYYVVASGLGLIFFLPFLIDKILVPRLQGFIATLVFPLAYTSFEYIGFQFTPFGTWGSLAYTQYGNLPLMQIASLTGIYGVTFLITWFAAVVNWAWEQQFDWLKISKGIKIYAGAMVAVLVFGGMVLVFLSPKSNEVKVAGVQSGLGKTLLASEYEWFYEGDVTKANWESILSKNKVVIDDLFIKSELAAKGGARIIAWAEASVLVPKVDEQVFIERGKQLAQQEQIYLEIAYSAILHTDPTQLPENKMWENKVVFITPSGDVLPQYRKTILVPGLEAMLAEKGNDDAPLINTPYGRISALICYDNDFPSFVRKNVGKAGVDLLIDPSGDWEDIDPYHTNIMAFRAIENGFSVLRVTYQGLSAAYDYQGRTLAMMDYFTTDDKILTAHIPEKGIPTIYAKIGDVFAWLCVVGFITITGLAVIRKRNSEPPK
jgi:apolipoprotein N-acyltransferase